VGRRRGGSQKVEVGGGAMRGMMGEGGEYRGVGGAKVSRSERSIRETGIKFGGRKGKKGY